jgi:hypothetical protein
MQGIATDPCVVGSTNRAEAVRKHFGGRYLAADPAELGVRTLSPAANIGKIKGISQIWDFKGTDVLSRTQVRVQTNHFASLSARSSAQKSHDEQDKENDQEDIK